MNYFVIAQNITDTSQQAHCEKIVPVYPMPFVTETRAEH